jgi:hypothetical protein
MIRCMFFALALSWSQQAVAQDCYQSAEYPFWTLTEGQTGPTKSHGYGFFWNQGGKIVELSTGSIGTGILGRQATEVQSGETHTYIYICNTLVFDMTPYELGCSRENPGSWDSEDEWRPSCCETATAPRGAEAPQSKSCLAQAAQQGAAAN